MEDVSATTSVSKIRPLTDAEARDLAAWRAAALEAMPYMASVLFALRPLAAPGLGTFAVDRGLRLYVDFGAVASQGDRWCAESLLHECGHVLGSHAARADEIGVAAADRSAWNLACFPPGTLLPGNTPIEGVASISRHYCGNLVQLATQAGPVTATPEHPFFARHRRHRRGVYPIRLEEPEWREAGLLTDSDYLCVPILEQKLFDTIIDLTAHAVHHVRAGTTVSHPSNRTVRRIALDEDTAWLIGLYVAEGSASPTVRFSLASYEDAIIERVEAISRRLGWSASRSYNHDQRTCAVTLGTTVFGRWLKQHCGDAARTKHVPSIILHHADPGIRRAFLDGLADGDGYRRAPSEAHSNPTTTVATSSESLMRDIVLLLAQDRLGCHTRVQSQRERSIRGRCLVGGKLYGVTWTPNGPSVTSRRLNGNSIETVSCSWKEDELGVWYPITRVGSAPFEGHVYNLTTASHTYIANSYLVHNCDAEINDDLVEAGCATIAADGILPASLGQSDHLLAETYFRALQRPQPDRGGQGGQADGAGGGQGEGGQDGQGGSQDGGQGEGSSQGQGQAGQGGCGSIAGAAPAPGELDGNDDAGGTAPAATAGAVQWVKVATAAAIRDTAAKSRGTVPAGLVELAEGILAPSKVPWRALLASTVRAGIRCRAGAYDHTYLRPDRRRRNVQVAQGRRAVYPGSYEPHPTVAVVRDTSGSMGHDDLMVVASEIEAIARRIGVRGGDLRVLDTDAEVHAVRSYTRPGSIAEAIGRGGTDMVRGIRAAVELRPRTHVIVVITDGMTPWPTEQTGIPVVACLVGSAARTCQADVPAWIRSVVVDGD